MVEVEVAEVVEVVVAPPPAAWSAGSIRLSAGSIRREAEAVVEVEELVEVEVTRERWIHQTGECRVGLISLVSRNSKST